MKGHYWTLSRKSKYDEDVTEYWVEIAEKGEDVKKQEIEDTQQAQGEDNVWKVDDIKMPDDAVDAAEKEKQQKRDGGKKQNGESIDAVSSTTFTVTCIIHRYVCCRVGVTAR